MNSDTKPSFAIVYAEMHYNSPGTVTTTSWTQFVTSLEGTGLQKGGIFHLHQNLWQIPLHTGLPALAKLVHLAQVGGIPIRVLFLAETPSRTILQPPAT